MYCSLWYPSEHNYCISCSSVFNESTLFCPISVLILLWVLFIRIQMIILVMWLIIWWNLHLFISGFLGSDGSAKVFQYFAIDIYFFYYFCTVILLIITIQSKLATLFLFIMASDDLTSNFNISFLSVLFVYCKFLSFVAKEFHIWLIFSFSIRSNLSFDSMHLNDWQCFT